MIDDTRLGHFREILEVIRGEFPGSYPVIGGGALRDSWHDRPIKDVDVFLRKQDHEDLHSPTTRYIRPPMLVQHGYGRADMHGAWDFHQPLNGYSVQLILADFTNLSDLARSFDIGLARITYDGEVLCVTPEFLEDSDNKELRIRRADNLFEKARSLKRVKRLREKYPDFAAPDFTYCPVCSEPIIGFRNKASAHEHSISGLCQQCQDSVFGED